MSAQVTEAHLELAKTALFSRDKAGRLFTAPMAAQLIADSEAKATAALRAEVDAECLLNGKGAEREADLRGRLERAEREVERLRHLEAVIRSSAADMTAGSITAGGVADLRAENERLRRAYVRPDDIRVQLESAIARAELAEAELANERARLDSGQILLTVAGERVWCSGVDLRAAIDAAMKEGGK